jgi:hypothetical protein
MFPLLTLLHADLVKMRTNYTDWGVGRSIAVPDSSRTLEGEHFKKTVGCLHTDGKLTANTNVKSIVHTNHFWKDYDKQILQIVYQNKVMKSWTIFTVSSGSQICTSKLQNLGEFISNLKWMDSGKFMGA